MVAVQVKYVRKIPHQLFVGPFLRGPRHHCYERTLREGKHFVFKKQYFELSFKFFI